MATPQHVSELLATITGPGTFATRRTRAADDLDLRVEGVGRIALPISGATARRLCAIARPARYGFKDQTRLDDRIRDTWEITKHRVTIDQRRWKKTFLPQLEQIRRDLGLPDGCRVRAALHNLLVYGPGQFFVTHQDSEKTDDMIGTLVVILPSDFTGGALVLEHHDEKIAFRGSGTKLTFIAFYADCHHRVSPVKKGYRVALTYNLIVEGDPATVEIPVPTSQIDALARCIGDYFETPLPPRWGNQPAREPPDRLAYLLDHQYTQRGLAWHRLKNADAVRVAALREVARRLDCEIFLALADVHETWSCEEDEAEYGRHGFGRWRRRYEEEEEEEGSETPALVELFDSDIELRHWIGSDGRREAIADRIDAEFVCYTKASVDLEPFASEHEGYTGNAGNTVDRWYHRAAVVLWPRDRTFVIRAKASPRWAVGEVAKTLKAGDVDEARRMVQRLLPFWGQVADREESPEFLGTLRIADKLDSPDLAASLLEPFALERLTPKTGTSRLVALLERYGLEWCRALLGRWASQDRRDGGASRPAWLGSLPDLCRALGAGDPPHGLELAQWLVREQWAWVVAQRHRLGEHAHPKHALDALNSLSKPILGLLDSSLISNTPDLHREILCFLTSAETDYPLRALARLLRTAHEHYPRETLPGLGLEALHRHCVLDLTVRLRLPARTKDDWSIVAPSRCACTLCATLARFLVAPDQVRFEWPLAKDRRAHIHGMVDAHDLPVSHTTRRAGRPFTLVLMKTDALFERDAVERGFWRSELRWLTMTARTFGADVGRANEP